MCRFENLAIVIFPKSSEQFTKNLIFDFLKENLSSFAVVLSTINTNPVNYS